jgi:hypothetical protein
MSKYDPEKEIIEIKNEMKKLVYVGWLLQKIPWKKVDTYLDIFTNYYDYLSKKYGSSYTTFGFDGYNGPSTKDVANNKR